ncbi:antibiotic biosynthesis monooxygenase family protein [Nonomuraea sp. NPDC050663]|uniref:antibiotic biosynthesis monooxygenase family protein n=1 Tax=Nonomuraea sp. NPDC050663 TaxID=3364370 RepID=UPI0037B94042
MIVRTWRGWTRPEDAPAYEAYLMKTGFTGYTTTPGNLGVHFTRREVDGRAEFFLLSYWESMEAVRAFAGDDPSVAVFYDEDDDFLIDRERTVDHYEVFASA